MKATFFTRFFAYVIDGVLLLVILSLVMSLFPTNDRYKQLRDEESKIIEQYKKQEIKTDEYISKVNDLGYDLSKESISSNIISVMMYIGYFIIFQLYNHGQTVGKRLMKIKLKSKTGELKFTQVLLRNGLIDGIFINIILLILIVTLNKDNYVNVSNVLSIVSSLFIIVSAFMILYRKDKDGLHDLICKTEIVKENGE